MSAKIASAAQATDLVLSEVDAARELLTSAQIVNGFGVLADPSSVRFALRSAIDRLNQAQRHFDAGAWPTRADYDAAEN